MSKRSLSFIPFNLYWQYSLDTFLTHIFVITFLQGAYFKTAAVLMSIDALFKVIFSVFIAKMVGSVPTFLRGRVSIFLKLLLIFIWFFAVSILLSHNFLYFSITLYLTFKLVILVDSYFSAEFIFLLRKYLSIDLTKSVAAQNILMRASIAIAPAVALMVLSNNYIGIIIFILALFMLVYSVSYLRNIFFSTESSSITKNSLIPLKVLIKNSYMRWGLIYQVVGNLAFAGVSFLLLKELKPNAHIFFNDITMLYFSFLLVQLIVFIYGDAAIPCNNTSHVALIMGLCGLNVFFASISVSDIRLICCAVIGLTYSFSLSGLQKIITSKLEGPGYVQYVGWAQMAGRSSSFIITMVFGYALYANFNAKFLLMLCGIAGIIAAGVLISLRVKATPCQIWNAGSL